MHVYWWGKETQRRKIWWGGLCVVLGMGFVCPGFGGGPLLTKVSLYMLAKGELTGV